MVWQHRAIAVQPSNRKWGSANGSLTSTVARFRRTRRHSQWVAELGYVLVSVCCLMTAGLRCLYIRAHRGHREHHRQDFHLPHLQLCSGLFCRGNAPIVSVVRCFEHFDHFVGVDRCVYVKANYLHQLFGVGALAHRGLPPFIGGLCGDHSPHRTTMTQTKCCSIFAFWVMVDANGGCRGICVGLEHGKVDRLVTPGI